MLVWIIKSQNINGATSVCLQKKEVGVPREWSSRQAAYIDGWAMYMYRHWAFARSTKVDPNQTSAPFTEPTQKSNFILIYIFFTFLLARFNKKKRKKERKKKKRKENRCSVLSYSLRGTRKADLIAAWPGDALQIDMCARQQQSSSFSSNRFIEYDVSTLGNSGLLRIYVQAF